MSGKRQPASGARGGGTFRSFLVRFLLLLALPFVLLGLLYLWVLLRSPDPSSGPLVRTADQKWVWAGDSVDVRLHFNGDRFLRPEEAARPRQPYAVALLIDHSGSMGAGPGSPLGAARMAASFFAMVVAAPDQPVGAIAFSDSPRRIHPPDAAGAGAAEAIRAIGPGGGTDIAAALSEGERMLDGTLADGIYPNARGLLILLSDGRSDAASALAAASRAKKRGYRIVTIGLGGQVDRELLRQVASSEPDYHYTLDPTALGDIYMGIAGEMSPVVGVAGELAEHYNPGGFTLEQVAGGFVAQVDEEEGRFALDLPVLFAQRVAFPYRVEAHRVGLWGLALEPARLSFVPNRERPGERQAVESADAPPVLVVAPWLFFLLFVPALVFLVWRLLEWLFRKRLGALPEPVPSRPPRLVPAPIEARRSAVLPPREPAPTLVVALGDAGRRVAGDLIERLAQDRYLEAHGAPPIRFLYVDGRGEQPDAGRRLVAVKSRLPSDLGPRVLELAAASRLPEHLAWLPREELAQANRSDLAVAAGTRGSRWVARLALFEALCDEGGSFREPWRQTLDWLGRQREARILMVGSLESGSSGMLLDLAYLLQAGIEPASRSRHPIYGLALGDLPASHSRAADNQAANLEELRRFLLAPRLPQPVAYAGSSQDGFGELEGTMEAPVFDGFFILQSGQDEPEAADRVFIGRVASWAHALTESSLAKRLEAQLRAVRTVEDEQERESWEPSVHTASITTVRFPLPQLTERLTCRFILELLGEGRLVGVTVAEDGAALRLPPRPTGMLNEAVGQWSEEGDGPADIGERAYRAYCRAARDDQADELIASFRGAGDRLPGLDGVREALRAVTGWLGDFVLGRPEATPEESAKHRVHGIRRLHALLGELTAFGKRIGAAVTLSAGEEPDATALLLAEIYRYHQEWHRQAEGWLEALVDAGCCGPQADPSSVEAGLYRRVNDRAAHVAEALGREAALPWTTILSDEDGNPVLGEDRLYHTAFDALLTAELGFLNRWTWSFGKAEGEEIPNLELHLFTDRDRRVEPTDIGIAAIEAQLREVAEARLARFESLTIFDKLRSEGDGPLDLAPLARNLADAANEQALSIDRQRPGGSRIVRQVLAVVPEVEEPAIGTLAADLGRLAAVDVVTVRHRDPCSIHLVVLESVIPIGSVRLRHVSSPGGGEPLPFVHLPERQAERARRRIEEHLSRVPAPELHPLTRLLLVAPMPSADWAGVLAEGAIREAAPGQGARLVLRDGTGSDPLVDSHQGGSRVWALLNLAYGVHAQARARNVIEAWRSRSRSERVEHLTDAVASWRVLASRCRDHQEGDVLEQIALLLELELDIERRRLEEVGGR